MNELVTLIDGEAVTTSLAIAEGTDNAHASVIRLVRNNLADLQEFGGVAFEIRPFETAGGVQSREIAVLNEPQSALLITYMRNNDRVRAFKKRLIAAFFELRERLAAGPIMPRTMSEALRLAADEFDRAERMKALAESNQGKADAFDAFLNGKGVYLVDSVANLIGAGHRALWNLLYTERVLISKGARRRQPYANPKTAGWFVVKTHDTEHTNGHAACTTYVTPFGAEQIRLLAIARNVIEPQLLGLPSGGA
ncbi:Rha family transcriptional regulator [Tsukamurella pseudospumae]|uniref:Antirepressor protein C-terminal domain-containing protein n=1 Tax=Tsukamurella pseudospumae TaxID=239498 RepID=A0A137ZRQ9_9ACTN|nr:phage regulatory protein/antirepressor Ant [Tsukamurella pseudospumae]KXP00856.1 hypothetical protein AXK61_12670 [Tsukamurella pseudospumae]